MKYTFSPYQVWYYNLLFFLYFCTPKNLTTVYSFRNWKTRTMILSATICAHSQSSFFYRLQQDEWTREHPKAIKIFTYCCHLVATFKVRLCLWPHNLEFSLHSCMQQNLMTSFARGSATVYLASTCNLWFGSMWSANSVLFEAPIRIGWWKD